MTRTNTDFVWLSPAVRALFRTTTAADGSFVLRGIPQGAGMYATIAAPKFGSPMVSWEPTQAAGHRPGQPIGADQGSAPAARWTRPRSLVLPRIKEPAAVRGLPTAIPDAFGPRTLRRPRTAHSSSTACRRAGTESGPTSIRTGSSPRSRRPRSRCGPGGVATVEIALRAPAQDHRPGRRRPDRQGRRRNQPAILVARAGHVTWWWARPRPMRKVDIRSRRDPVRMRSGSTGLPKTYLVQDRRRTPRPRGRGRPDRRPT